MELSVALRTSTVAPLWETHKTMSSRNSPETRNPAGERGFCKAFGGTNSKVDGSGNGDAECKRNLLEDPDERQG